MSKFISSHQNALIKKVLQLQEKSRLRKKEGLFVLEGRRELELALSAGFQIQQLLWCSDLIDQKELDNIDTGNAESIELSKDVYEKLAYRGSTEGVIAITKSKDHNLKTLHFNNKNPLILVAEAPEKPGNIGALLRTADAANLDAVLIANPKTDIYNPNIIRSSVGCVFTNQVASGTSEEIIEFLKENEFNIFAATLQK